jgi:hypothetical protein
MEDFDAVASRGTKNGFVSDLLFFITHNKRWWVTGLVLVLLVFGGLMMLAGTAAAPFIYTLF